MNKEAHHGCIVSLALCFMIVANQDKPTTTTIKFESISLRLQSALFDKKDEPQHLSAVLFSLKIHASAAQPIAIIPALDIPDTVANVRCP
ncbi:hypothetical protein Hypma_001139 [Hypsizygus marmoreus]|uniref:Uncharacterized protein n=1 Tax=Hypsizygus marmoreus TaxID=39966 RepID=A0A369JEA2_HYPMA|nr:hypothetical protein Hypma_001139 [Hypsizygus marmoreus]